MGSQPDYTMPPQKVSFSGFLFDMDGTIIDSTPAIVKHWHTYVGSESAAAAACSVSHMLTYTTG